MPRQNALPKYVQKVRKKERTYLYFRFGDGTRAPLPTDASCPDFHRRYAELLAQRQSGRAEPSEGTVGALIKAYLLTPQYRKLAKQTQWHHRRLLDELAPIRPFPVAEIRRRHIRELRDTLSNRPRTADIFLQVARRLFALAVSDEAIDINPAVGIESLGGGGHYRAWTEPEAEIFEAACREGRVPTWALTAYLLGRYTSQRRGDILRLNWAAYDGRTIRLRQSKTGTPLVIPAHERLKAHLDGLPRTGLLICLSPTGKAWDPRNFTRELREALDKLGMRGVSFHGLRHMAASALADAGASERQIMSVTGHSSPDSVSRYVRAASQERMAAIAIGKLPKSK